MGAAYERVTDATGTQHRYFIRAGGQVIAVHKEQEAATSIAPFAPSGDCGSGRPGRDCPATPSPLAGEGRGEGDSSAPLAVGATPTSRFLLADPDGNGSWTEYLHRDHQGSIVAITSDTGDLLARFHFDAWGQRSVVVDASGTMDTFTALTAFTTRGYTGHEHLQHVGLIHMNGRVYDPAIGRFLSADPFMQFPDSTQGLNRYTYVGNNPLSYRDPSGFFLDGLLEKVVGLVGVVLNFVPGCQFWCQVGWSAITGGVSGYLATGSFKGAIRSAVGNAALTAIGHNFGAGGKGVNAVDSGWNFHKVVDVLTQTTAVFNPKAAAKLALLNGAIYHGRNGPLSAGKFLADSYVKQKVVRPALQKYANRHGLSLTELNVGLAALSFAGNGLVGSRYDSKEGHFKGWDNRGPAGLFFDAVDTILAYQGLPTASSVDYMLDENAQSQISGHSLGAIDANNLVAQGFAEEASLMALPIGNAGMLTRGSNTELVPMDFVSGFIGGWMLNPMATASPNATFDHSCSSFTNCPYSD